MHRREEFPYVFCIDGMMLHDMYMTRVYNDNSLLRALLDCMEDAVFIRNILHIDCVASVVRK